MAEVKQTSQASQPEDNIQANREAVTDFKSWVEIARNSIAIVVALSAIFGASGFLIVNIYLAQFGSIQGFSVVSGRYISASLWLLLVIVLLLFTSTILGFSVKPMLLRAISYGCGGATVILTIIGGMLAFFLLFLFTAIRNTELFEVGFAIIALVMVFLTVAEYDIHSSGFGEAALGRGVMSTLPRIAFTMLCGIYLVTYIFGTLFYPSIPQYAGGGQPLPAQLILSESADSDNLPLPLSASNSRITEPIEILAELNDGLLIHDRNTNTTLVVKNDSIVSIVNVGSELLASVSSTATGVAPMTNISSTTPLTPISSTP